MNRRSFLLQSAAVAAGCCGLQRVSVAGDRYVAFVADVDLLLTMDDTAVRKKVGDIFMQYLRTSPTVRSTFFPSAPDPEYRPQGIVATSLPNLIAPMLVAWSLAHVSTNGFSRTVNESAARNRYYVGLHNSPQFAVPFSDDVYKHFFPDLCTASRLPDACKADPSGVPCQASRVTFRSLQNKPNIGQRYCEVVASDSFYVKAMARRLADPKGFDQYLHLLVYMAEVLAPDTQWLQSVHDRWGAMNREAPWTTYEYLMLLFDTLNEQTFLPEVQAACNVATQIDSRSVVSGCQGGPAARCRSSTKIKYGYGVGVENWINQQKTLFSGVFTNDQPDNEHWQ